MIIGIGDDLNVLELYGIASKPVDETVFIADSYRDLPQLVQKIPQAICDGMNCACLLL